MKYEDNEQLPSSKDHINNTNWKQSKHGPFGSSTMEETFPVDWSHLLCFPCYDCTKGKSLVKFSV